MHKLQAKVVISRLPWQREPWHEFQPEEVFSRFFSHARLRPNESNHRSFSLVIPGNLLQGLLRDLISTNMNRTLALSSIYRSSAQERRWMIFEERNDGERKFLSRTFSSTTSKTIEGIGNFLIEKRLNIIFVEERTMIYFSF